MTLLVERFTLEASPSYPLNVLATRYTLGPSDSYTSGDDYTLICMHAIGSHKESWEVTIRALLSMGRRARQSTYHIRDVYSIECPNHGESAVLNEDALNSLFKNRWPTREYTRAVHAFLTAGTSRGAKVDFQKHKLVAAGHCLGALSLFFMHEMRPRVRIQSIIAIEPGFSPGLDYPDYRDLFRRMQGWVWLRRDVWADKKAAFDDLSRNPVFSGWDQSVLFLYIEHALSDHPASKYPQPYTFKGVVVSTTKEQEAATYRSDELIGQPLDACNIAAREVPVHLIWGDVSDVLPSHVKHYISEKSGAASVEFIKGAGHLILQQKPELIAHKIHDRLTFLAPLKAVL
ncbi:alpha/beta-hydrolase [Crassisporium funariophilum]|nr:alpha/beta-hydrolase [Crassisporium funariophilum]